MPKAAPPPNLTPALALDLPPFKWGRAMILMRCELPAANDNNNGRKPLALLPETKKREAAAGDHKAASRKKGARNGDGLFSATTQLPPLAVVDEDGLIINPVTAPVPEPEPVPVPEPEPVLLPSTAPNLHQEEQGGKRRDPVIRIKIPHYRAAEEEQEPAPPPPKKRVKAISPSVDDQHESSKLIVASKIPEEQGIRIPYTKKELDEDIKAIMSGTDINSRPPRRHRKRRPLSESRLFPGSDLPRLLTLDRYQLKSSIPKRRR